jgi:hypothetical protein
MSTNNNKVTGEGTVLRSYKAEVIADSSGKFCANALRFATREEAESYVFDLSMRWTAVRETRVSESDDPVNYEVKDGALRRIEKEN